MANYDQVKRLTEEGVDPWNAWRKADPDAVIDLRAADLTGANLMSANLTGANLADANLTDADLDSAELHGADLTGARLIGTDLSWADLAAARLGAAHLMEAKIVGVDFNGADLTDADLSWACVTGSHFTGANLRGAKLIEADCTDAAFVNACLVGADLQGANLLRTNLTFADLTGANLMQARLTGTVLSGSLLNGCHIHGISTWDLTIDGLTQHRSLILTRPDTPTITADNLEVAQLLYLFLNNHKLRDVVELLTTKVVLVLGHFTDQRTMVLDAIIEGLRNRGFTPVIFDFENTAELEITETVLALAHMSRFIIADFTDTKRIPLELVEVVPTLRTVPVQPLLLASQREDRFWKQFEDYPWMLPIYHYKRPIDLVGSLVEKVLAPAESMAEEFLE